MAATGNEVARLEQLKGLYPRIVSFRSGKSATITLGNGKVVAFSASGASNNRIYLLGRVMYSCFVIVQAVSDISSNATVKVICNDAMNTFKSKYVMGESSISYIAENGTIYAAPITYNTTTFNIGVINGSSTFIGALIYVD